MYMYIQSHISMCTCAHICMCTCAASVAQLVRASPGEDGRGFESHPRQPILLRKMTVSGELCCVALPFCCVVVVALPFSASLEGLFMYMYMYTCGPIAIYIMCKRLTNS